LFDENAVSQGFRDFFSAVTARVTAVDEKISGRWHPHWPFRRKEPETMRTQITAARLKEIKVHAYRDSAGGLHVTGITLHGALVIPTRSFWLALAEIAAIDDPEFGEEYSLFKQALKAAGNQRLHFTVSVTDDGTALLDDVTSAEESAVRATLIERFRGRAGSRDQVGCSADTQHSFPLLKCSSRESNTNLWGWDRFHRLPKGEALLDGPDGTLRPSRN
jgi:hypothetical protein